MKRGRIGFPGRWLVAVPVLAAIAAMAAAAAPAAAVPTPPMPGYTPAVQAGNVVGGSIYYTGTDTRAYEVTLTSGVETSRSLGGQLIGGPGAAPDRELFGRGTDNALWQNQGSPGKWSSLGGRLTSRPGVAEGGVPVTGGRSLDVVVRGTNGAVWDREIAYLAVPPRVLPWRSPGGRVLAGTGPAAVSTGGALYVLAVGTDRAVWVTQTSDGTRWSGWRSLGGQVSGDLGAASPAAGTGIVFARGTDNAAWYNQFAGTTTGVTPGWHSLGGRLSSGVGGVGVQIPVGQQLPSETRIVAMGTDNRIWQRVGSWPRLSPWTRVY